MERIIISSRDLQFCWDEEKKANKIKMTEDKNKEFLVLTCQYIWSLAELNKV